MLGERKLKSIANKVLKLSTADETEVLLIVSDSALTRFAQNRIHQNEATLDIGISVRAVLGKGSHAKKIGVASANSFDDHSLGNVVQKAYVLASLQKEDPHFVSLPTKQKIPRVPKDDYQVSEKERAKAVATIIKKAAHGGAIASGAYRSGVTELVVANSHGVWAYHAASASDVTTIFLGDTSTGFAEALGRRAADIDPEAVANHALQKVLKGANPQEIEPGEYEVVLEPPAVTELMAFFAWLGPNARIYHEKASNFSGKLGKKVLGGNVTILDDPLDKEAFPMPFDFEGFPKTKLPIVKNGVLENLVYDSYHANRYKAKNTGHALPAPNTAGPIPLHLVLQPGKKSHAAMIKSIKKGLLVTRFWYVRVLNPRTLSLTGMTRDGTFLIENGEVTGGVKNLRFNQSIPDALNNVVEVGNKLHKTGSFETELGVYRMPYLHVKGWNFSSGTLF